MFFAKQKKLKFEPKMPYCGIFYLKFEKTVVMFEIRTLECVKMFHAKIKIFEFGTKNALFEYFWDAILKNSCHI